MTVRSDLRSLDEATAYDRLMLETVVGGDLLIMGLPTSSVDDLRGDRKLFARTGFASLGDRGRVLLLDELRPLILVTAWKLLDLVVEYARYRSGLGTPPARGWRISEKVAWAKSTTTPSFEPFSIHPELWGPVAKPYARLENTRNAVIHRRFKRSDDRGLVAYGVKGRPLRTVSVQEIDALAFLAYGVAEEVIAGRPAARRCLAIAWRADQLRGITRLAKRTTGAAPELRRVVVDLRRTGRRWLLDLDGIRAHLASQGATAGIADIEAHIPGTPRRYMGRLEEAPTASACEFAASRPPEWLAVENG